MLHDDLDWRSFLTISLNGITCLSLPTALSLPLDWVLGEAGAGGEEIRSVVRDPMLFAGIRKPIRTRDELVPRIRELEASCNGQTVGPLTHIFRFDTPVDGYDSAIGFPAREPVNVGDIRTWTLRRMHFFSNIHEGSVATLPQTRNPLCDYRDRVGLSPELELVEAFHRYDPDHPENQRIESMASYLPWPEKDREELVRALGEDIADVVGEGGERITPHTPVDERGRWVGASIERLEERSTQEVQFDVLSRVALVGPPEDIEKYRRIYERAGDLQAVFDGQHARFLEVGRTQGRPNAPWFDGRTLHLSKVPYNEEAYLAVVTPEEIRKAFCFCALVREAEDPRRSEMAPRRPAPFARRSVRAARRIPPSGRRFGRCGSSRSVGDPA